MRTGASAVRMTCATTIRDAAWMREPTRAGGFPSYPDSLRAGAERGLVFSHGILCEHDDGSERWELASCTSRTRKLYVKTGLR